MRKIHVIGCRPARFEEGFALLSRDLRMAQAPDGYTVELAQGDCLALSADGDGARVQWHVPVECWRALSILSQRWGETFSVTERACFETLGVMFDVSRNAVLKPETLQFFFRKMALLGFHLGMLYTEDTYEVDRYPYFGYLRGRYSQDQLRALDDYADALGIELCPCIQTLGHLNRALHWPAMEGMKDTEEVLLVDDERTQAFIRAMLESASAPYRSRRIHIGMDEAHFLGLGAYLRRHGYARPFDIMRTHLAQVSAMVRSLGLEAMMWSDMYFRLSSPTGGYYDAPDLDRAALAAAPEDITLVYWDYYHAGEEDYDRMFRLHQRFAAPTAFAGGIWTWTGPAPHYEKTLETCLPGLRQAKEHRVPLVLATAWGDNGGECCSLAALYGLAVYAQFCYTGEYDRAQTDARFRETAGADPQAFLDLTRFNRLPGVKDWSVRPVNASKFLLYQDPLVPLYQADMEGVDMAAHYRHLAADYRQYRVENPSYRLLFDFYAQLAETLADKCLVHQLAGPAVRAGDRQAVGECAALAEQVAQSMEALRRRWRELWYAVNRVYGFEILDIRLGGCAARLESAASLLLDYAAGKIDTIEPLAEDPLPYTRLPDGALKGSYAWGEIVSACKADL